MQLKTVSIMLLGGGGAWLAAGRAAIQRQLSMAHSRLRPGRIYNSPAESYMAPQQAQYQAQVQPQQVYSANAYSSQPQLRAEPYQPSSAADAGCSNGL